MRPTSVDAPQLRSLLPREHGAYVELLAPLLVALLFGSPTWAALSYALWALLTFLAHEPCLVLLERRGVRTRQTVGVRARSRLVACVAVGSAALGVALLLSSAEVRLLALIPVGLSLIAGALLYRGRERTFVGQLVVAATLTSFSLPVLASSGVSLLRAAQLAGAWMVIHALASLTARAVVYRKREGQRLLGWAVGTSLLVLACASLLYASQTWPLAWCVAPWPFALLAATLSTFDATPRTPKPVGWALAGASFTAMVLFGLGL